MIHTGPGILFKGQQFKELCSKLLRRHIECPMGGYIANGYLEKFIRTLMRQFVIIKMYKWSVRKQVLGFGNHFCNRNGKNS